MDVEHYGFFLSFCLSLLCLLSVGGMKAQNSALRRKMLGEEARLVKCLSCKHGGLSLSPRTNKKINRCVGASMESSARKMEVD